MRTRVRLLLLAAALACDSGEVAPLAPERADPAGRTAGFLRAVHASDCDRAWYYLSRETQQAARLEGERKVRDAPYAVDDLAPVRLYCAKYRASQVEPVKLISESDDHAVVEVLLLEPTNYRLPGFSPREVRDMPIALELVHEEGEWRLALAKPPEPERGWTEIERAGVTLRTAAAGDGWRLWVLAAIDAPAASVEKAAMDWERWPDWVPELRAVTRMGTAANEAAPGPILGFRVAGEPDPILRIRVAGEAATSATFPFHRYVSIGKQSSGFSAAVRPLLDVADLAVYPDPGGITRLQLILARSRPIRGSTPPGLSWPDPPSADRIVDFVRALERAAAAEH